MTVLEKHQILSMRRAAVAISTRFSQYHGDSHTVIVCVLRLLYYHRSHEFYSRVQEITSIRLCSLSLSDKGRDMYCSLKAFEFPPKTWTGRSGQSAGIRVL